MTKRLLYPVLTFIFLAKVNSGFAMPKDSLSHKDTGSRWSFHFQFTAIDQYHGKFNAPYHGQNSLQDTTEQDISLTATIFLGLRLWKYGAVYFNPEVSGGRGFSGTTGIAGFPNGEIYRVGNPAPAAYAARAYFEQSIALKGSHDTLITDDVNQVRQYLPTRRITISAGKFSLADFFDNNPCSHDARNQFMNWTLMDNGAWDYPANTKGYTFGAVVQLIEPNWYINLADALEPYQANGGVMDPTFTKTFGLALESGFTYKVKDRTGGLSVLLFMNQNRAANYEDAIAAYKNGIPGALNIDNDSVYAGNKKYGIGISFNHPIGKYVSFFMRAGWNDGKTGDWAFTEVDQTITPGFSFDGTWWKRKNDTFGTALIVNGLSKEHIDFENAGGYQFIIGDGKLPNYKPEEIWETYYNFRLFEHLFCALDYQFVVNPAYNADRGPVSIGSIRVHVEF
ncbi:MAG TPA: carbohydrate porin [Bacteroidia bacterium]|jgi:high affinity Mn2+ porin|nr:carbohydrate porin [Bacteroidia bacterium]